MLRGKLASLKDKASEALETKVKKVVVLGKSEKKLKGKK